MVFNNKYYGDYYSFYLDLDFYNRLIDMCSEIPLDLTIEPEWLDIWNIFLALTFYGVVPKLFIFIFFI